MFLFVDSRWHEPHDAVQCRAHGSTFEFLFEFQTEFFSNFLFEVQVVPASNCSTLEGPLYNVLVTVKRLWIFASWERLSCAGQFYSLWAQFFLIFTIVHVLLNVTLFLHQGLILYVFAEFITYACTLFFVYEYV